MQRLWPGPEVELLLEPTASTTAENAARTLPLLVERQIEHAVVICSPLHFYRARWFFRQLYAGHGIHTGAGVLRAAGRRGLRQRGVGE